LPKIEEGWQKSLQGIHSLTSMFPQTGFTGGSSLAGQLQQEQRKRTIDRRPSFFSSLSFFCFPDCLILLSGSFASFLANLITLTPPDLLFTPRVFQS
jgi:hypothetical protein